MYVKYNVYEINGGINWTVQTDFIAKLELSHYVNFISEVQQLVKKTHKNIHNKNL